MPTCLRDILDIDQLERLIASRHILQVRHPTRPVSLYDYATRTQFEGRWTPETRAARGLVVHDDGRVLARPIEKFFNFGEHGVEHLLPEGPIEVADKLDGSLVVLWHDEGQPAASTRGSFVSDQARWALDWLENHGDLHGVDPDLTLCFEFVSGPRNRVVLDYGDREEAVLVAARRISDGTELDSAALAEIGVRHRVPVVPVRTVERFDALLAEAERAEGIEGWVVRSPHGRIKVKVPWYRLRHKLLFRLGAGTVRDALRADGSVDGLCAEVPEEFWSEVRAMAAEIVRRVDARNRELDAAHRALLAASDGSRRDYARLVKERASDDGKHLFALLDGKETRGALLAEVDLAGVDALGERLKQTRARMER